MPGRYPHAETCDILDAEITRFVQAVRGADVQTPVPTCGRWKLADLIHHVTSVHRWSASMVRELSPTRHSRRKADLPFPADPRDYADWVAEAHEFLVKLFRDSDPDAKVWVWGPEPTVRFWPRRMIHETAVHRADAELALGREPAINVKVALDGVDEFLENLRSAGRFSWDIRHLRGDGQRLRLAAADRSDVWTITLHPKGFSWEARRRSAVKDSADVTVTAKASDLYLLLWRRRTPDEARFTVDGDRSLLEFWHAHSAV